MMLRLVALLLACSLGIAGAQARLSAVELRSLAATASESLLVARAREQPDELRSALREALATVARGSDSTVRDGLGVADRLASAYALAWGDSFFVRQLDRFRAASPERRRDMTIADSLRLAGNAVLATVGVDAAMRRWRESLRRVERVADTARIAAALGNLGAGFYEMQQFDSAEMYLTRSRELAERVGDYRTAGNALGILGSTYKDTGNLRRAVELYEQAAPVRERTGDTRGLAADRNNLGLVFQELGDLKGARRAFDAALEANRRAGRQDATAANLLNLGNIAALEGSYAEAARRYREALAIYRELGARADVAQVLHNLGGLSVRRGDYRAAVVALGEAARVYRATGPAGAEIAVRRDLANARAAAGDLQSARAELARAEQLATTERGGAGRLVLASLALARADLELQLNRLREAERQYERAEQFARGTAGGEDTRAAAQQGLGAVLLMSEHEARARSALELALRTQTQSGDRRGAALTRLLIGYAEWRRQSGDTTIARRFLGMARDTLAALGDAAGEAAALASLGELEVRAGLPLTAESLFHRGLARLENRVAPSIAWQLHAGLGRALENRRDLSGAVTELRRAVAEIERTSGGLPIEERRAMYLADKWDVYNELAMVELARGDVRSAFDVSEQLRARQMVDLLARGRIEQERQGAGELAGREQDLRRRIGELTRHLEETPGDAGLRGAASTTDPERGATPEALAQLQDSYAELLVEIHERQPAYAALVRPELASARDIMQALSPNDALLEYLVGDSTTIVFVVTSDSVAAVDLNVSHDALAELVDFTRVMIASPRREAVRESWSAPLRRLYQQLVGPLESRGLIANKRRLFIAPHAELHYLPFAGLVRTEAPRQFLIERYTIEYVPSAAVWLRLRARPRAQLSAGVLALAPRVDALPGSRAEVTAVGRIYGASATVLTGAAATESAFRADAPTRSIVHLATYGVLNKRNPLFSFIQLGPGEGEDGRLEAYEVAGLTLSADLVVLSACQTGVGAGALSDVPAGDDWVGLVRAFLTAGAGRVVATLWPVEDLTTAKLMERFYRRLAAGAEAGDALADAQRSVLREQNTAHPFFWAPFAMVVGR